VGNEPEEISLLPLVKAYPNLSRQYGEVSCVAAIVLEGADAGKLIRIYPIPFRELDQDQQFQKYQPIRVTAWRPNNDQRPESRKVDIETMEITGPRIDTSDSWAARRDLVEPVIEGSMCGLLREEKEDRTSLRILRPQEVLDLKIEEVEPDPEKGEMATAWTAQANLLEAPERQAQRKALEQIPYKFKYVYKCTDPGCEKHTQSIVDWEIAQLYRRERHKADWKQLIRTKFLDEMCGPAKDIAFIVGNQKLYRNAFLVLGIWWPPTRAQLSLVELGNL
jgi:hypothetical protein